MNELLNVLYVQTQGSNLRLDHDAVVVEVEHESRLRLPLLALEAIVVFGRVSLSPFLIQRCADDGRSVVWLDRRGRFKARVEGQTRGNVLLRRAQHLALCDGSRTVAVARQIVAAKLQNSRQVLLRAAREAAKDADGTPLRAAAGRLERILPDLRWIDDLDQLRGAEGEAGRAYFGVFGHMVRGEREAFAMGGRSRRPPRDRVNALLSFLYALLRAECTAAIEGVGLDPQVGYLHALRPGRPALALDMMEELRAVFADRLALRLVNRRQLKAGHFEALPGGAVQLTDEGRGEVIRAYQKRKEEPVEHRVLGTRLQFGLVPHVQARLLARHLRGDLLHYPPFLYRG
ncbi:MAG: type I-C CRISPR-associated endonuclease Cas1c [Dehalococcoidia bacterium]